MSPRVLTTPERKWAMCILGILSCMRGRLIRFSRGLREYEERFVATIESASFTSSHRSAGFFRLQLKYKGKTMDHMDALRQMFVDYRGCIQFHINNNTPVKKRQKPRELPRTTYVNTVNNFQILLESEPGGAREWIAYNEFFPCEVRNLDPPTRRKRSVPLISSQHWIERQSFLLQKRIQDLFAIGIAQLHPTERQYSAPDSPMSIEDEDDTDDSSDSDEDDEFTIDPDDLDLAVVETESASPDMERSLIPPDPCSNALLRAQLRQQVEIRTLLHHTPHYVVSYSYPAYPQFIS